jgi:formate dehydrogenase major subunit
MSARDVISFSLNGSACQALPGETILQAAQRSGVDIPHLCYKDGYRADGNCRACVVEIDGERTLAPSCCRAPSADMQVHSNSSRATKSQKMVLEMLLSDMPDVGYKWNDATSAVTDAGQHGELSLWADKLDVKVRPALKAVRRAQPAADISHPAMAVNLDACIQCNRCVRACREEQVNGVIGYAQRGAHSAIVFDLGDTMGTSTCVGCGECVQACPTGALMPKTQIGSQKVDKKVDSVCPYCGVGCLITYNIRDEKIVSVEGRDGPANQSRLCVKGRFGFDYVHHDQRLTKPLIRKTGIAKDPAKITQYQHWSEVFREATWQEALDLSGGKLKQLRDVHGKKSLAGFGSAKGSNEEAYLFQKLVRTGFGSNNVDHCTRLCHASSVAALLEGVGSGAVSNQVNDVEHSELIFIIGSNPTVNHPVAATWMKNAAQRGAKIVLADPRRTDIAQHAWRSLQFKPDTDVLLLNALIHAVIDQGLVALEFIAERASNFEAIKQQVQDYSPEAVQERCGIDAQTIKEVAHAFATSKSSMILWGMGISQHIHGTDNARCLIALCTITGQLGKPGSGLHPLRGQNNVQGASDAGLIPMMLPNYQRVTNPAAHQWFEDFWHTKLDDQPGYTVVEIMHKALVPESDPHKIRGMYVMGENPAMSDPDLNHARHALASLSHLVVQDIFMTETAWLADVVLPASAWPEKTGTATNTDRMVQLGRVALPLPGDAQQDLWIIQELAKRLGLSWQYAGDDSGVASVYEEMRQAMHGVIAGITWQRLEREGSVTYPCLSSDDPGQPMVFIHDVPTDDGRIHLVPAGFIKADESPDTDYPLVLITGRQLEHWHTGSMTRRSSTLDALEPLPTISINGNELARLQLVAGDRVQLASRRGAVQATLRRDDGTPDGTVFMPFAYREAAANLLTNAALDPVGKIPEFKYCAVRLDALVTA